MSSYIIVKIWKIFSCLIELVNYSKLTFSEAAKMMASLKKVEQLEKMFGNIIIKKYKAVVLIHFKSLKMCI